jgi:hypothetical protein
VTLPASLPISASQINTELNRASNASLSLLGGAELMLGGQTGAPNSISNFVSKANPTVVATPGVDTFGSSHSFTGVNFGPVYTGRIIFVQIFAFSSNQAISGADNITNINLGGDTNWPSPHGLWYYKHTGNSFTGLISLWSDVPSTTSGTISFTTGFNHACALVVWSLAGLPVASPYFDNGSFSASSSTLGTTLQVNNGGTIISGAVKARLGDPAWSINNLNLIGSGPTTSVNGDEYHYAWGMKNQMAANASQNVTWTASGGVEWAMEATSLNP